MGSARAGLISAIRRRTLWLAAALVFSCAAGVFLVSAYAAWANDETAAVASEETTSSTEETTTDAAAETVPPQPTPTEEAPPPSETGNIAPPEPATEPPVEPAEPPAEPPADEGPPPPATVTDPASSPTQPGPPSNLHPQPVLATKHKNRVPEANEGGYATIWLHRTLPDPTPPAERLSPAFAHRLLRISRAAHIHWWLVLGVIRARGGHGAVPVRMQVLERLSDRLARLHARSHPRRAILVLTRGNERFRDRAVALARYDRAVGLRALVRGLEWAKPLLERRVLHDRHIDIYEGGRADVAYHRVDVRVLVLIRYLRVTFGHVRVSSLVTGHRYFARPGVVSAHMYGLAVDVSALASTPISGHQEPGGLTERAIEAILLLPSEVLPQQVISLLGLGGPSFPLADHYDHIHVGY